MTEKTLPAPQPDGTCTACNISDFTLAQDKTAYSPCEWDAQSKTFSTKYGHTRDNDEENAVRFFCANCGERHMVPEGLV